MKKLIIHIGYPKTATTTLQLNLYAKMHEEGKIEYLNHLNSPSNYLGEFYCGNALRYIMGMSDDYGVKEELEKFKKINNTISLISNENISFFSENYSWAYHNSDASKNAQRICDTFSPYFDDIQILIFTRAQATIIPSFYGQCLNHIVSKKPIFNNMQKWLDANFYNKLNDEKLIFNYDFMYDSYCKEFGADKTKVCLFEDLSNNQNRIATTLSLLFNVEKEYVNKSINRTNKKNVTIKNNLNQVKASSSSLMNRFVYYYNKYLSYFIKIEKAKKIKNKLLKIIPNFILGIEFKNKSRGLSNEEKIKILNKYEKVNLSLMNKLGYTKEEMINYLYLNGY